MKNKDLKGVQIRGYTKTGHSKFWTKCIQYVFFATIEMAETAKAAEQEKKNKCNL